MLKKSQALIIIIFVMMALALVSWTVVNFTSVDVGMNTRLMDSERALYLADSGAQWAANQASNPSWCANFTANSQCGASNACKLGSGEYTITCNSASPITVTSTGYIPSQAACTGTSTASCLGTRVVQQTVPTVSLNKLIQVNNYFDWSGVTSNSTYRSELNGEIRVAGSSGSTTEPPEFKLGDVSNTKYRCAQSFYAPAGAGSLQRIRFYHDVRNGTPAGRAIFKIVKDSGFGLPSTNPADIIPNTTFNYQPGQNNWQNHRYRSTITLNGWYWMVWDLQTADQSTNSYFTLHAGDDSKLPPDFTKPNPNPGSAHFSINGGWQTAPQVNDVMYIMSFASGLTLNSDSFQGYEGNCTNPPNGAGCNVHNILTNDSNYTPGGDYGPNQPLYTPGLNPAPARGFMNTTNFPTINMDCFKNKASNVWPPTSRTLAVDMPWAMVPVGKYIDGKQYRYAQSFVIPGSTKRNINYIWTLHGTTSPTPPPSLTLEIWNNDALNNVPLSRVSASYSVDYTPDASSWDRADFTGTAKLNASPTIYWLVWDPNQTFNAGYTMLRMVHYGSGTIAQSVNGAGWTKPYDPVGSPDLAPDVAFFIDNSGANILGDSSYLYASQPGFFTNMANEAIRNYGKAGNWDNSTDPTDPAQRLEWGVIGEVDDVTGLGAATLARLVPLGAGQQVLYHNDSGVTAWGNLDTHADDWYDTDNAELVKRFTGSDSNNQNWYIAAGAVFDASSADVTQTNKSFVTENDIGLVGRGNTITLTANAALPQALLASGDGDIYSTTPSNSTTWAATAQRRNLQGMVYTQGGTVNFDYLWAANGTAMAGYNLYLSHYINANYNAAVVNSDCFSCSNSAASWQEQ